MEFGIEKCAMLIMRSRKQEMTERIEIPNEEKYKKTRRKGNRLVLGDIGKGHY